MDCNLECHSSKILQEYRRKMKEKGIESAKTSQVVSVASKAQQQQNQEVAEMNVEDSLEEIPEDEPAE